MSVFSFPTNFCRCLRLSPSTAHYTLRLSYTRRVIYIYMCLYAPTYEPMSATGRRRQQHYEQCFNKWIEQYSFVSQRVWCVVPYIYSAYFAHVVSAVPSRSGIFFIQATVLPRIPLPSIYRIVFLLCLIATICIYMYIEFSVHFVNQFHSSRTNE